MKNQPYTFLILYFLIPIALTFCSTSFQTSEYPEWEPWPQPPDEISIEVEAPEFVSLSDTLSYQIKMTNQTDKKLLIHAGRSLSGSFEFNLAVVNDNDEVVWVRMPDDKIYQLPLYGVSIDPGESHVMNRTWNLKDMHGKFISSGTYRLFAGLHGMELTIFENDDTVVDRKVTEAPVVGSRGFQINIE